MNSIINFLSEKYDFQNYLEIGISTGNTIRQVKCKNKDGVDPQVRCGETNYGMTSDEFFKTIDSSKKWDVILIDGLHTHEQVKKDFLNSMNHLSDNGFILMDDTNPPDEGWTHETFRSGGWCGTTYRFIIELALTNKDIEYFTFNIADGYYGLTVIRRGHRELFGDQGNLPNCLNWKYFSDNKQNILNLTTKEKFFDHLNKL